MKPVPVIPVETTGLGIGGMYTADELTYVQSVKPMTVEEINNCPKVCANYLTTSNVLPLENFAK
ncbi:hypothetical protein A2642_00510 [Candidatus Nomurabacteria bacterium RIFCSPHIGHO2_01_FULL_39_10]|uniref:Uncharacterized protein n=1 Tax=Candidatus Nomurabacteria bacterium RIFCSPHIGHO2_01_FULL_39_10 TaxID=1801733 RepID=A0A1F6V3H6_9BACT|nr:MAG: hypothetical protein A2642_00510 [Candidatus Nomurabacteria bacterium RIFCSPHIGHO2_01_FULL_39_10]